MPRGGARPGAGRPKGSKSKSRIVRPLEKECSRCKRLLPGTHFHIDRGSPEGIRPDCKDCVCAARRLRYDMSGQSERDRYTSYRASARRRGLAFRLTIEQFQDIRRQPCFYGGGTSPVVRVGIDRRDNAKGYTVQNSLPCCNRHNEMRSHFFTHKEMIFIVQNVKSAAICGSNNAGRKKLSRDMPFAE